MLGLTRLFARYEDRSPRSRAGRPWRAGRCDPLGRDRVGCICLFTVGDRWERSRDVFLGFLLLLAGEPVYVAVVTRRAPLDVARGL